MNGLPDSRLAREITQYVRDTASDMLFQHSARVYWWGTLLGDKLGLAFDPELLYAAAMFHDDQPAVTAELLRKDDDSIGRGVHGRPGGCAQVDALVHGAFAGEGIFALAERAHQAAIDGPEARLRRDGEKCAGMPALERQHLTAAQEVVVLDALRESRGKLAFCGNAVRAFDLLLDAVCQGNFLGVDFETGELLVGLADHFLQILVTEPETVGFPAERVVVGDFPRHPRIAGHHPEHRKTTQERQGQDGIDGRMRNMNATKPASQGMSEYYDEIFLLHSIVTKMNCTPWYRRCQC